MNDIRRISPPLRALPLLAALALGCAPGGPGTGTGADEIAAHRAQWVAQRPAAYVYELQRSCFCPPDALGPVRIRVQGTTVVSRVYVESGDTVRPPFAELFPTVDGLFDLLDDAVDRKADQITVTWSTDAGYPLDAFIDYIFAAADEEQGFHVSAVPVAPGG